MHYTGIMDVYFDIITLFNYYSENERLTNDPGEFQENLRITSEFYCEIVEIRRLNCKKPFVNLSLPKRM